MKVSFFSIAILIFILISACKREQKPICHGCTAPYSDWDFCHPHKYNEGDTLVFLNANSDTLKLFCDSISENFISNSSPIMDNCEFEERWYFKCLTANFDDLWIDNHLVSRCDSTVNDRPIGLSFTVLSQRLTR